MCLPISMTYALYCDKKILQAYFIEEPIISIILNTFTKIFPSHKNITLW